MVDETVKALRDKLTSNGAITLDADGVGYILDMIERMGNMIEKYECEVIPDYHKLCEQLQAENSMLKSGNKQIIEDYKLCIAERDELKANQPVRCGEVASHSEKEIVSGCITLMERLKNKFGEYLDFVGFEPECEEEWFSVGFHYNEIIRTLLLSGTSHSGGASTAKKCRELGFDYSKMVEFEIERRE